MIVWTVLMSSHAYDRHELEIEGMVFSISYGPLLYHWEHLPPLEQKFASTFKSQRLPFNYITND